MRPILKGSTMNLASLTLAALLAASPALAQQGQPGAHFIESWDGDMDGAVTVEEATARRGDVFFMFDANEDGLIDAGEYVAFDETRARDMEGQGGHGQGAMRRADEGMTLLFNDVDADGAVSREEFLGQVPAWIALMDRDGDGVVTTADFGPDRG
jgi:Ca2+-binding EF-hand superfamily protein